MPLQPSRMPPIRTADGAGDDKRGTEAGQAVTYTFLNELSPPPVDMESADLSCFTVCDNSPPPTPQRSSHNKRRDASYIPRPPNAFILFRSSFIRDQKVSNKVEGNHSNLSKIIGMYWKALTKEQRDEWEAKAAQALIEHRKRYPDWRFRHAANASANVESRIKVKDGARRGRARKDPPDRGGVVGAEDDVEESPGKGRAAEEASRLTKIAGLLAEGQEGKALERAVEEWEAEQRLTRRSASVSAPESSASADKDPVSGTRSPIVTRVCSSSSMDPDLPPTTYGTPVPSPSLSAPSPIITRASSTEREPSLPYPSTPTPRIPTSASSPSTPRLSLSTSTSASGSLLKLQPAPAPSWPASPVTPQSLASTPSSRSRPPLPWPPSPAPLIRTPGCCSSSSFPAYAPAERWESEHSLARARSKASSSEPVADTLTPDEELSTFMTRASSSEIITTRQCLATSTSTSTPNEVLSSPSQLSPPSPRTPLPCTPTPTRSPTRAIRITPSKWPNSPTTPQTSAPWSPSPGVPRVSTSFPTSAYTRTRTETETETDIDTETETGTKEWEAEAEASLHATRLNATATMIKSALSSPVVARASVSASASAMATAVVTGLERAPASPARVYVPSTPTDLPSASTATSTATSTTTSTTTSTSTSTPPVPIPKLPPSWPASPSTSTSTSASAPPAWSLASPLVPTSASASFPAFTRAEDWEFGGGHEFAREPSPAVLSSPIMIHASASPSTTATRTRNGDPHTPMSSRRPSVSSPLKTMPRTPVSTTSWPASPALDSALALVMSSPVVPRTPGHTASWSNVISSPAADTPRPPHPHPASDFNPTDSPATPTPTLSRRSRPQSRSPTQRSPQNPNALCVGMKRSLSAPAPKRGHHRQWWQHQHQQEQEQEQEQVPVRMDEGFWWPVPAPAPHEQGHCRGRDHESAQERENENENEKGVVEVPMQVHMATPTPTRDGSFDVFTSHDQETEHEFDLAGGEIDERVWSWSDSDFGYDSKPTSMYSSNPAPVQITPSTTAAPAYQPRFQHEPTPAHERWFNPWDADTTVHAGEYLHPLPPTPISPISTSSIPSPLSPPPFAFSSSTTLAHTPCSSFSSLAGWDGTTSSDHANANANANVNVNSDADADRNAGPGTCAPPKATVAGAAIDGVGWGRGGLQRLGVQGGGYGVDCQWVG